MAKQNPSVGHSDNGCGPPCKGSFYQERRLNIEKLGVGGHVLVLRHPCCNCNTGCRRVTLWHPRPVFDGADDWIVKAIARVRWGDGCGGPEAEIDWKHGVILDLSGCYDEVSFEIVEIVGTAPDEDVPYVVGVLSACCGAGAARGCATRTTAVQLADFGGLLQIPVPPFAYAVTFATTDPAGLFAATNTFYQLGSGAPIVPATTGVVAQVAGDVLPDPWLIANGVETIGVENETDAEGLNFEAVFLIGV